MTDGRTAIGSRCFGAVELGYGTDAVGVIDAGPARWTDAGTVMAVEDVGEVIRETILITSL